MSPITYLLFAVFAAEHPHAPSFFGIPVWILAVVFIGIDVLRIVGDLALRDNLAVDPSAWQRVLSKARSNPRDLPSALVRKLQRHGR